MSDLFQSPSASFNQPLELLLACHGRMEKFSAELVTLANYLPEQGWDDKAIQSAQNILNYFNKAAPLHHQDEEQNLFPLLIKLDPTLQERSVREAVVVINELIKEHVEQDKLWEKIKPLLEQTTDEHEQLSEYAITLKRHLDNHIKQENDKLITLAQARLSDTAITALGQAMAKRRGVTF